MKTKFFLVIVFTVIAITGLKAQYVTLANGTFRTFLINRYPSCFNASLQLDTTCTAITSETFLDLSNQTLDYLHGLKYFDNLRSIDLSNSYAPDLFFSLPASIQDLDLSSSYFGDVYFYPPNLKRLDISDCYLEGRSIPSLPAGLEYFNASNSGVRPGNPFALPPGLKYLNIAKCEFGGFTSLPSALDTFICNDQLRYDQFTAPTFQTMPVLPSTLKYLDCSGNGIESIPNLPAGLKFLKCNNQSRRVDSWTIYESVPALSSLPALPAGLEYLDCSNNALSGLSALPSTLTFLNCSGNYFSRSVYDGVNFTTYSSPGIPNFISFPQALTFINVGGNRMTSIPALPDGLIDLTVNRMQLNSLPSLPGSLRFLDVSNTLIKCLSRLPGSMVLQSPYRTLDANLVVNNYIDCLPNRVPGMRIKTIDGNYTTYTTVTVPVCNFFNNSNDCIVAPTMAGYCFYDNNSNGIQDAGELPMSGVKVSLYNGEEAFSDENGLYNIGGDTGINNLTVHQRGHYSPVPSTLNYDFSNYDTLVNAVIALKPDASYDSLKITITPLNPSRPGFDFSYEVKYENAGTTVMTNAVVQLVFDIMKMTYQNSSTVVTVSGNTITMNAGTLTPGQHGSFISSFTISASVVLGSEIISSVSITSGTKSYSDQSIIIVQGSFDPNDKLATKVLSRQQVLNGAYIDYLIRFQNTGTDTAFNVQILDELDAKLDAATFMPVASSHACISKRTGNYLAFEFKNILLADSNINEPASHGYVRFRVKPKAGLPDNTNISNAASIYFDFNAPVNTPPVSSLVNLTLVPTILTSFDAFKQDKSVRLTWSTAQEINSKNFIVERAGNDNRWEKLLDLPAAGNSQLPSFYEATDLSPQQGINYYRLRCNDIDYSYTYSPIRKVSFEKQKVLTLSANPAKNAVSLITDISMAGAGISIIDVSGKIVVEGKIKGAVTNMDISHLSSGIYYVIVIHNNSRFMEILMVR